MISHSIHYLLLGTVMAFAVLTAGLETANKPTGLGIGAAGDTIVWKHLQGSSSVQLYAAGIAFMLLFLGVDTYCKLKQEREIASVPVSPRSSSRVSPIPFCSLAEALPRRRYSKPSLYAVQQSRRALRSKCGKQVTFGNVSVRELVWEAESSCEHGVPQGWQCSIGAEYSQSVDVAQTERQVQGRLSKEVYCWTARSINGGQSTGPKSECSICWCRSPSPPLPPSPQQASCKMRLPKKTLPCMSAPETDQDDGISTS